MQKYIIGLLLLTACMSSRAQDIDKKLPIRGFAIEAPSARGVDAFIRFIEEELAPAKVNLLILRVDWNYAFVSHPELQDPHPLSKEDAGKLVAACRKHGIRLVPQVNLLGHQSWAKETYALLREYPQFDENPSVKTEFYSKWPNPYRLYCKSYCPLHPDVHKVVFEVVDEICEAFRPMPSMPAWTRFSIWERTSVPAAMGKTGANSLPGKSPPSTTIWPPKAVR